MASLPQRLIRRPTTLRDQFVAGGVALVALASILIGIASSYAVGRTLIERLDEELVDTARRLALTLERPVSGPLERPGFAVGTVVAVIGDEDVSGAYIDEDGNVESLTQESLVTLTRVDWEPRDPTFVRLLDGRGEYRALLVGTLDDAKIIVALPLQDIRITIAQLNIIIIVVVLVVILVGASIGAWLVRVALRPLDRITDTASAVTKQPLDRGDVRVALRVPAQYATTDSEVGQVGAALNLMLDHVDDAFKTRFESEEKMRRFVADASHELRTPLAAIRGYAELTKRSGQKLSPELTQALDRIESESVRMTTLVEDLLLLARLDEGQPLTREPVDIAEIVRDAISDAYVTSPKHVWSASGAEKPVMVTGDGPSLYQVVSNLLANARIHTPEGTKVEVSLRQKPRTVEISVQDSGPGISPETKKRLFQRFARGDSSRARQSGSTGLGLAIVDTIVRAHQGTVSVSSRPGKTVFRVTLPLS